MIGSAADQQPTFEHPLACSVATPSGQIGAGTPTVRCGYFLYGVRRTSTRTVTRTFDPARRQLLLADFEPFLKAPGANIVIITVVAMVPGRLDFKLAHVAREFLFSCIIFGAGRGGE